MYTFQRLNYEVPFDGAEYLVESDVERAISVSITPQAGFVNWFFGGSSTSLVSYDGTHTLTESDSSLAKIYGENYVSLPANAGTLLNGLNTEYFDASSQTICACLRYTGQAAQVLMGGMDVSHGECISMSGAGVLSYLYRNSAGALVANAIPTPDGLVAGNDIFIALTRSGSDVIVFAGGANSKLAITAAKTVGPSIPVGLGNTAFVSTAGYSKALLGYELLYSATSATATALDNIYSAAKTRCATRGISIL